MGWYGWGGCDIKKFKKTRGMKVVTSHYDNNNDNDNNKNNIMCRSALVARILRQSTSNSSRGYDDT